MLAHFIRIGHELGLRVHGSLNVFAGGHNFFDRGIIYGEHADWQSQVYTEGASFPSARSRATTTACSTPRTPRCRRTSWPSCANSPGNTPTWTASSSTACVTTTSPPTSAPLEGALSRPMPDVKVAAFPKRSSAGSRMPKENGAGPRARSSAAGSSGAPRSSRISSSRPAGSSRRSIPGCWSATTPAPGTRPTYYVGVNWASEQFDPAQYFDWATPEYKTGYAEELDIYMTGLYYTLVTKAEVDAANGVVGQRTEAGMTDDQSYWYCIEGGAEWARRQSPPAWCPSSDRSTSISTGATPNASPRRGRGAARHRRTDALRHRHIIQRNWWPVLAEGIARGSKQAEPTLQ